MTIHAIRCRRTGRDIAVKLDGGECVCPTFDHCCLKDDDVAPRAATHAERIAAMEKADAKFYGTIRKAKNDEVVPDDEWVAFLFKDTAFAEVLPLYRDKCVNLGCDAEQIAAIDRMISRMRAWRATHPERVKIPDAKGEKLLG